MAMTNNRKASRCAICNKPASKKLGSLLEADERVYPMGMPDAEWMHKRVHGPCYEAKIDEHQGQSKRRHAIGDLMRRGILR